MRAGYLIASGPSGGRLPDYISTTNQDIDRLYADTYSRDNRKLDFMW